MKTTFNLRLPGELCSKIEKEAQKNRLSINQYILYTLTKTIAYSEALEILNAKLSNVPDMAVEEILSKIPERKPLKGDKI
ncbi:MAG: toxin-antitoxin system HicB family antitoxin [Planctomycetes bacterium]|nr:toxin-antitoxin system HicB family antitoxin [Planctomycetota bacterium]